MLAEGERFGLASLPNGPELLGDLDGAALSVVEGEGGLTLALDGEVLKAPLFLAGDQRQSVGGFEAETGRYLIGFEDNLLGNSDADFNDVLVSVNFA